MHVLTEIIRKDMVPALGVTEPGAIAFVSAKVKTLIGGTLKHLTVVMNSGLYKNAYSCGLPGADQVGAVFAAALGYAANNAPPCAAALWREGPAWPARFAGLAEAGRRRLTVRSATWLPA